MSSVQFVDTSRLLARRQGTATTEPLRRPRRASSERLGLAHLPAAFGGQAAIIDEVRAGLREVELVEPVDLARPAQAVAALRLVRDLTSCRVDVRWTLAARGIDVRALCSLQPPAAADLALDAWRETFRYGLLYWRAGPKFVIVRDARDGAIAHFTIDEPPYRELVDRGHAGADLRCEDEEALRVFEEERLLWRLGDERLFVPYRMRHWPIPFNSI